MKILIRGLRAVARAPAHFVLVVGTLALGIGASATMFTLLDQVVLRPLPVENQDGLVVAWGDHRIRDFDHFPYTLDVVRRVDADAMTVDGVAGVSAAGSVERLVDEPDGVSVMRWSRIVGDFFGVLGVTPATGRLTGADDDVIAGPRVVVVSSGLWQRRWGGSPDVIGASIRSRGELYTVVGVAPEGFDHPSDTDLWVPWLPLYSEGDDLPFLELDLVARMAPGGTPATVARELDALLAADPVLGETYSDVAAVVVPYEEAILGDLGPTVTLLFAGALFVLAVALGNVTNLVTVRQRTRDLDLAVRRALGAGTAPLVRQAVIEGAVTGASAAAVGAALTWTAVRAVSRLAPPGLPRLEAVVPDARAVAFAAAVGVVTTAVLTLVPVLRAGRVDPAPLLRGTREVARSGRAGRIAVAAQCALATWTVTGSVLMLRTVDNLQSLDLGFDVEGQVVLEIDHPYPNFGLPEGFAGTLAAVSGRLGEHPRVSAATALLAPPLAGNAGFDVAPILEGQSREEAMASNPFLNLEVVQEGYFDALGLDVVRGRGIDAGDRADAPRVAVVNEEAARLLWPAGTPLGRVTVFDQTWSVIGVARDARYRQLTDVRPSIYLPLAQMPAFGPRYFLLRTTGPVDVVGLAREAFAELAPDLRVVEATRLDAYLDAPLARPRFSLSIFAAFAAVILTLTASGVYGVMATVVRGRIGEMGVRIALGAPPAGVWRLVMGQALAVVALGSVAGLVGALATGRFVRSLLFGVAPADPVTLAAGLGLVVVAGALATGVPAARAAAVDPARALHAE